jgi:hypothetical protein
MVLCEIPNIPRFGSCPNYLLDIVAGGKTSELCSAKGQKILSTGFCNYIYLHTSLIFPAVKTTYINIHPGLKTRSLPAYREFLCLKQHPKTFIKPTLCYGLKTH